jgi:hypothetical protein
MIGGHEGPGVVTAIGSDVRSVEVGFQRVWLPWANRQSSRVELRYQAEARWHSDFRVVDAQSMGTRD